LIDYSPADSDAVASSLPASISMDIRATLNNDATWALKFPAVVQIATTVVNGSSAVQAGATVSVASQYANGNFQIGSGLAAAVKSTPKQLSVTDSNGQCVLLAYPTASNTSVTLHAVSGSLSGNLSGVTITGNRSATITVG